MHQSDVEFHSSPLSSGIDHVSSVFITYKLAYLLFLEGQFFRKNKKKNVFILSSIPGCQTPDRSQILPDFPAFKNKLKQFSINKKI